ncbi:hypothetical protein ACFPN2_38355 [Steroidobacter flavus]|uniref:Uncharacterized protein n=1 Tax=Steroidobacter flavus TaxID=1842136 RepID=A0ABV8T7X9_9GAMM
MLSKPWTWIDERSRREHQYLAETDRCLFRGEFSVGGGASGCATRQLLANFKRKPTEITRGPNVLQLQGDKERAIAEVAIALREAFGPMLVNRRYTFVPIPGSKCRGDPDYCDRLERALKQAFSGYAHPDVRPLLQQTVSTVADHERGAARASIDELMDITRIDVDLLAVPARETLIVFDDVLTFGKHFRVASARIREALPRQAIIGLFIARAVSSRHAGAIVL